MQTPLSLRQLLDALQAGKQLDWLQEIRTAGDLWKALHEGKTPAVAVSAVSIAPPYGPNIVQPKFPKPPDQLKSDVLDRAIAECDAEGGNPAEAMRKLIARIALARGVDRREIINMPLARFVEAAGGRRKRQGAGKRKTHKRASVVSKPLTPRQVEVMQIVAECKGDLAEAARRLGLDRKTVMQHYTAAEKKLGKAAVKHATCALPRDRRGQAHVAEGDDRR